MFSFKKKSQKLVHEEDFRDVGIFIQDHERVTQMNIIGLKEEDLRLIRRLKPHVEVRIREVVEAFYGTIEKEPQFTKVINENSTYERLRQTLRHHIVEMMRGCIDDNFIENRRKVAMVHVRIGLTTRWYLAAFQKLEGGLRQIVYSMDFSKEEKEKMIDAISKICNFEQQIVLEEYEKVSSNLQAEQQKFNKAGSEIGRWRYFKRIRATIP